MWQWEAAVPAAPPLVGNNSSLKDSVMLGKRLYELTNHLGNVLAVISDKKVGVASEQSTAFVDHYVADVTTAQDYYPFGMLMPGRKGYQTEGGWAGAPSKGGATLAESLTVDTRNGSDPLEYKASEEIDFIPNFSSSAGDAFEAYITEATGGGSTAGGTIYGSGPYRYGFNGKEQDDEVKGEGAQQDYGFRIYDPRLGKFLSVDPLTKEYPMFSSYQYAGNRPIVAIDLEGLEPQEHPYQLKPIGKPYIGVTTEGNTYEAYQVNSISNGKTWVVKIIQKVEPVNGFEMKPIEHFMYHNPEGGWQPWQLGDEPSIRNKMINQVANSIGVGFYGVAAAGAAAPALANLGPVALRGLANEASLLKYIPKSYGTNAMAFAANLGLQFAFNGKGADFFDAALSSTPYGWMAWGGGALFDYKPLENANRIASPLLGTKTPEASLIDLGTSAPFLMFGKSLKIVNPSALTPTKEYILNAADGATNAAVNESLEEKLPKPKK